MPSFSRKAAQEYVDSGGDYCPACHSNNVTAGESDWEGNLVSQKVVCEDCGCIWYDWFKLYSARPETAFGDEEYASVEKGSFKVEWENLHENEAEEPEYLRFTVYREDDRDEGLVGWEQIDDASYCTNVPASTPYAKQLELANVIMDEVYPLLERGSSIKRACERLSHINELGEYPKEDFLNAAAGFLPDGVPVELPDGSGMMTGSFPLPKDHWIYDPQDEPKPDALIHPAPVELDIMRASITRRAKYAIRAVTQKGRDMDFDPDALVQCIVRMMVD